MNLMPIHCYSRHRITFDPHSSVHSLFLGTQIDFCHSPYLLDWKLLRTECLFQPDIRITTKCHSNVCLSEVLSLSAFQHPFLILRLSRENQLSRGQKINRVEENGSGRVCGYLCKEDMERGGEGCKWLRWKSVVKETSPDLNFIIFLLFILVIRLVGGKQYKQLWCLICLLLGSGHENMGGMSK